MEKLSEGQEQLLAYLEFNNDYSPISKINVDLNNSSATISKNMNILVKSGYVLQSSDGRIIKYKITELGKKYVNDNKLYFNDREKLDKEKGNMESVYKANEILSEIEMIKNSFDINYCV